MVIRPRPFPVALALVLLIGSTGLMAQAGSFQWDIPKPFPTPPVPAHNPMSAVKVELGRRLFYDLRMSVNGKQSCATCHRQELAFTDGRARSVGATGVRHPRSSMSLANSAYSPGLTWSHPTLETLEDQALMPLLGTDPVELGMQGEQARFLSSVRRDSLYQQLFRRAFPQGDSLYTMTNVVRAIAAFQRTILSLRSPYDRYRYGGDTTAISGAARRGEAIFFSGQRAGCFQCHGGWNFSGAVRYDGGPQVRAEFFNTGLYNVEGANSYPAPNTGIHALTGRLEDVGKFRVPTLRNIAVTAPYMHDGSIRTLVEVIDHYAAGGRTIVSGPYAGRGSDHPNKAAALRGFALTEAEKRDLIAFLESLTDTTFLRNPALSNPWRQ